MFLLRLESVIGRAAQKSANSTILKLHSRWNFRSMNSFPSTSKNACCHCTYRDPSVTMRFTVACFAGASASSTTPITHPPKNDSHWRFDYSQVDRIEMSTLQFRPHSSRKRRFRIALGGHRPLFVFSRNSQWKPIYMRFSPHSTAAKALAAKDALHNPSTTLHNPSTILHNPSTILHNPSIVHALPHHSPGYFATAPWLATAEIACSTRAGSPR